MRRKAAPKPTKKVDAKGGTHASSKGGKPSRRSAVSKAPAAQDSADEDAEAAAGTATEGEGDVFLCPWPGCDRQFDRIKSRSAHLKWHGGNYKGSNGGEAVRVARKLGDGSQDGGAGAGAGGGGAKKRGADTTGSASSASAGSRKTKRQRGNGSAASPRPGFAVGAKIIVPSGEHAGKVGIVSKIEDDADDGKVYHAVVDSGKGKASKTRTVQLVSSDFDSTTEFTEGMQVFCRSITPKGPAFRAGTIEEIREAGAPSLYRFVPRGFESEAAWVPTSDLIPDKAPSISQLRTGTKVCALPGDKNGTYYYVGSIQRVESSRIRVNFDSFSIAWRKAHEVRVLSDA